MCGIELPVLRLGRRLRTKWHNLNLGLVPLLSVYWSWVCLAATRICIYNLFGFGLMTNGYDTICVYVLKSPLCITFRSYVCPLYHHSRVFPSILE